MKAISKSIIFILLAILIVGCNQEMALEEKGVINISISNAITKGVEAISMKVTTYKITAEREGFDSISISLSDMSKSNASMVLHSGNWNITAVAFNNDGIAIGGGTTSVAVAPSINTECSIEIKEYEGNGTLSIELDSKTIDAPVAYALTLEEFVGNEKGTEILLLKDVSGKYIGSSDLPNGFYYISIVDSNGTAVSNDTFRIVKGQTTKISISISLEGSLSFEINNGIVETPKLDVKLNKTYIKVGDTVTATVTSDDLESFSCRWYLDSVLLEGEGASVDFTIPESSNLGNKILTCVVADSNSSLIWSESISFNILAADSRLTAIDVSGDVEIWMQGDVLIPRDLGVALEMDGSNYKNLGFYYHEVLNIGSEMKTLTCSIEREEYEYYFEAEYDSIEDRTHLYIIIDRYIENPAYLEIDFQHDDFFSDDISKGIWVKSNSYQFSDYKGYENRGFLLLNNRVGKRIIEIDPDSYNFGGYSGPGNVYPLITPNSSFTLASGETKSFKVETPHCTINLKSDYFNDESYSIMSLNNEASSYNAENGIIQFINWGLNNTEFYAHSSNEDCYYTFTAQGEDDETLEIEVEPIYPEIYKQEVDIPVGRVYVSLESDVALPYTYNCGAFYKLKDENGRNIGSEYLVNSYRSFYISENCKSIEIMPMYWEGYDFSVSYEDGEVDGENCTLITIHVTKEADENTAYLIINYDFSEELNVKTTSAINLSSKYYLPICSKDITTIKIPAGSYYLHGYWTRINSKSPKIESSINVAPGETANVRIFLD